ncbi:MAG: response regulator [Patescibacteria group bacterium]|nr:response regulator [Patescibacteria group bacterium]
MPEALKKILIVEDERLITKPLAKKLQFAGFEVKAAYDGEEALAVLETEKFDLILLDLLMPRVDGFDVLTELKKRGDLTPVIVATNLNQEKDVSRVLELGVTSYYVKSDTTLDEIVENVKRALNIG